jgi:hypothetical protein
LKAYDEFEKRVEHLRFKKISKGKITKKEIMEQAPEISKITVE